jgi:hypothetical protein
MYVKIESERLRYLQFNQKKLRAEEYIHLRDTIVNNADANQISNAVILPSPYIGCSDLRARIWTAVFIYHVHM